MIEYIRRYLSDPEVIPTIVLQNPSVQVTSENILTVYLRRYLADPL